MKKKKSNSDLRTRVADVIFLSFDSIGDSSSFRIRDVHRVTVNRRFRAQKPASWMLETKNIRRIVGIIGDLRTLKIDSSLQFNFDSNEKI